MRPVATVQDVLSAIELVKCGSDAILAAESLVDLRGSAKLLESLIAAAQTLQCELENVEALMEQATECVGGCRGW